MLRARLTSLLACLTLSTLTASLALGHDAHAAKVITIGTLMPAASSWGKVLKTWADAVRSKSGGAVELQFFFNGGQGDEGAMVGKIKDGQLDGALVSAVGLGKIHKPILALEIPGLFAEWAKADAARNALKGDFEKGAKDAGCTILGWADIGVVHLMSKGFAINVPDDIKGKRPYMWRDDVVQPVFFQVIGGITPVPLNIPEVLPNLNTGAIDIVAAPSLFAEQLQWTSKLDTIVDDPMGFAVGALVISSKVLAGLSEANRNLVVDTAKIAANAMTKRIRDEDAAAFERLKGKMTVVDLSDGDKAKWAGIYKQLRAALVQGTFSADLVAKLEGYAK